MFKYDRDYDKLKIKMWWTIFETKDRIFVKIKNWPYKWRNCSKISGVWDNSSKSDIFHRFWTQSPFDLFLSQLSSYLTLQIPELAWKKKKRLIPPAKNTPTLMMILIKSKIPVPNWWGRRWHWENLWSWRRKAGWCRASEWSRRVWPTWNWCTCHWLCTRKRIFRLGIHLGRNTSELLDISCL